MLERRRYPAYLRHTQSHTHTHIFSNDANLTTERVTAAACRAISRRAARSSLPPATAAAAAVCTAADGRSTTADHAATRAAAALAAPACSASSTSGISSPGARAEEAHDTAGHRGSPDRRQGGGENDH